MNIEWLLCSGQQPRNSHRAYIKIIRVPELPAVGFALHVVRIQSIDRDALTRLEGRHTPVRAAGAPKTIAKVATAAGRRGRCICFSPRLHLCPPTRAVLARLATLRHLTVIRRFYLGFQFLLAQERILVHEICAIQRNHHANEGFSGAMRKTRLREFGRQCGSYRRRRQRKSSTLSWRVREQALLFFSS